MSSIYFTINFYLISLKSIIPSLVLVNYFLYYFMLSTGSFLFFFFKKQSLSQVSLCDNRNSFLKYADAYIIFLILLTQVASFIMCKNVFLSSSMSFFSVCFIIMFFLAYFVFNAKSNYFGLDNLTIRVTLLSSLLPFLFFGLNTSWFMYLFALEFLTLSCVWFIIISEKNVFDYIIVYIWSVMLAAISFNVSVLFCYYNNFLSAVFFIIFISLKLGIFPFGFWVLPLYSKLCTISFYSYLIFFYMQLAIMTYFCSHFYLNYFCSFFGDLTLLYVSYFKFIVLLVNVMSFIIYPVAISERTVLVFNTWCSSLIILILI